ncbi:hypothetical protein VSU16_03115 [Cetobacterium somerae]|uniref:hypothetical protein n=1 Tax=Cetobacterium somerae TaxID=188913 RepID=UPI002E7B86E0|nr:hypothetical protein [Cetobacterium somerae]WVJ01732.1 hypothetical protein VSU16_03115 [Cetobacterium somerae]
MEIRGIKLFEKPQGVINRYDVWLYFDIHFINNKYIPIISGHGANSGLTNCIVNFDNPSGFQNGGFKIVVIQAQTDKPLDAGSFISFSIVGRWK